MRTFILDQINTERDTQQVRWGNDHDDNHSGPDFVMILARYLSRLGQAFEDEQPVSDVREQCVKIAATCVAIYEATARESAYVAHPDLRRD